MGHYMAIYNNQTAETITIHEAARLLSIHPNTLRNWEKRGVMVPVRDSKSGYRKYSQEQIRSFLLRGKSAKLKLYWGYQAGVNLRLSEHELAKRTLDVGVGKLLSTVPDKDLDTKFFNNNRDALARGVKIRFIRDLSDPIQKDKAEQVRGLGIQTRDGKVGGMTFAVIDLRYVKLEFPSDNPDYRLNILIDDPETAASFANFFETLWKVGSRGLV
ncbi:MAG: Regulatory protein MerR [Candidatus Amesbacteria bacterium GW2011_GWC1_48_10]|uniref:Regulatory protein MerR n=2 Tax=Candidatus Amesiibacteriota TaxID=1752730 RepID=A0A0G1UGJ4_9BACT|nr:MAG: Regulatory protein MerR [Candidatus Amesbacteria bacterium GW2011_GWC1_48_10]